MISLHQYFVFVCICSFGEMLSQRDVHMGHWWHVGAAAGCCFTIST